MKRADGLGLDPYQTLANAVVQQAAEDYRASLKRLARDPENHIAADEIKDLRRFFRSGWYSVLTSVDCEYLIKMLDAEYPDVEVEDN